MRLLRHCDVRSYPDRMRQQEVSSYPGVYLIALEKAPDHVLLDRVFASITRGLTIDALFSLGNQA